MHDMLCTVGSLEAAVLCDLVSSHSTINQSISISEHNTCNSATHMGWGRGHADGCIQLDYFCSEMEVRQRTPVSAASGTKQFDTKICSTLRGYHTPVEYCFHGKLGRTMHTDFMWITIPSF
jgi:hypothetical protein